MKLHLGCNDSIMPGYLNVDSTRPPNATDENFLQWDLSALNTMAPHPDHDEMLYVAGWPWADSSVDEIVAHDVLEHIDNPGYPGSKGIIWCLNEAHRVLKPGGKLDLWVPCLPGEAPFVDPTHVQVWTQSTRYYFDERWNNPQGERGRLGPGMGITALFKSLPVMRVQRHSTGPRPVDVGTDWVPVQYAPDAPERSKLFLLLEAVK